MSNSSDFNYFSICFQLPSTKYHTVALVLVNVPFVLPLCLYILLLGLQQWRSGARVSHTDFFTYNMVVVQLISIVGSCLFTVYLIHPSNLVLLIGIVTITVSFSTVIVFQILMCLERYLAVVHPVTFVSLKSQTWTLIRNISCACVWLQCVIQSICGTQLEEVSGYFYVCVTGLAFSLLIVLYCNLRVLCVLLRPRPGDGAKGNKTKHRALCLITAITGTLLFKLTGDSLALFSFLFMYSYDPDDVDRSCAVYFSVNWFCLPSTLVVPMLFLQRNGKLQCFKANK